MNSRNFCNVLHWLALATMVFTSAAVGAVNVIRVSQAQTSNDGNSGGSWAAAKRTVGGALAAVSGPTQIWIQEGTYFESLTISTAGVELYGGFKKDGSETSLGQRSGGATVIDGGGLYQPIRVDSCDGTVLDRLTVQNGTINWHGGGIYLYSATNAVIRNCTVTNCTTTASGNGGGISITNGSTTLDSVTIRKCLSAAIGGGLYEVGAVVNASKLDVENCKAVKGGGIGLRSGDGLISGSTIRNNVATSTTTEGGGGIYMYGVQRLNIIQNIITSNQANFGAALDCYYYTSNTIANNLITQNVAGTGAITVHGYASAAYFVNNTVSDNRSTVGVSALSIFDSASAVLRNELYTYNSGPKAAIGRNAGTGFNVGYCSAWANTNGTFDDPADADNFKWSVLEEDPMYLNRVYLSDPVSFQLTPDSPGRDYGMNNNLASDFAGAMRPVNSRGWTIKYADKGAYEYQTDYQNVPQFVTMQGWWNNKPNLVLDQSAAKLHFRVFDANNVLLADTWAPQSSNGFYLVPLGNSAPVQTPVKILISAKGYLTAKVVMYNLPNPVPCQLSTGQDVELIPGDADGDNQVGLLDLNVVFVSFFQTGDLPGDIDGDRQVGAEDFNLVMLNFMSIGEN